MASADYNERVAISNKGYGGRLQKRLIRGTLAAGVLELVTGFSHVELAIGFTEISAQGDTTEVTNFAVEEDLPNETGTLTIRGLTTDDAGATKPATTQQFACEIWGY